MRYFGLPQKRYYDAVSESSLQHLESRSGLNQGFDIIESEMKGQQVRELLNLLISPSTLVLILSCLFVRLYLVIE